MNTGAKSQKERLTLEDFFVPSLQKAIVNWHRARHAVETERGREQQNSYCAATQALGQSLSEWQTANPALAEQFRFFFTVQE